MTRQTRVRTVRRYCSAKKLTRLNKLLSTIIILQEVRWGNSWGNSYSRLSLQTKLPLQHYLHTSQIAELKVHKKATICTQRQLPAAIWGLRRIPLLLFPPSFLPFLDPSLGDTPTVTSPMMPGVVREGGCTELLRSLYECNSMSQGVLQGYTEEL